ncbi:MAG: three-Cys-motif partner protein TcmP [Planctomycetia bacterium]|nr:three-Cys-motif partner protein TcmP [Planctomycetia bacterium]
MADDFFNEQTDQSQVKATIVAKYFWAWATIISKTKGKIGIDRRIAYIDLFAGPGRYKSGAKSTPLLILEQAINDPQFHDCLVTYFNDKDSASSSTLKKAISELPGIERLKYKPQVQSQEVGEQIVKKFEELNFVPTLFFVDPWGYKGLSLRLINSVLKDWACECIFFFNYTRVNMGISNPVVKEHMEALFGKGRAESVSKRLECLSAEKRELAIVEEICSALKEMGGRYVLPFTFKTANGSRTSHHLIFVSKHPLGYGIMKEIMARESSTSDQGVAKFEYNPADVDQPLLFALTQPLDDLRNLLLQKYTGKQMSVQQIFDDHNVDTPYILKNYKEVLRTLFEEGAVDASRPLGKSIRKNTFPEDVVVSFPEANQ